MLYSRENLQQQLIARQHRAAFGSGLQPKQSGKHDCSALPENYAGSIQLLVTPNADAL